MTAPQIAIAGITIDCHDPAHVARFWSELLGLELRADDDLPGWFRIGPIVTGGPHVNFQPVPEAKTGKTRIHLELWVDDLDAAARLVERGGGRRRNESHTYASGTVTVMADPEGNEFCLVATTDT